MRGCKHQFVLRISVDGLVPDKDGVENGFKSGRLVAFGSFEIGDPGRTESYGKYSYKFSSWAKFKTCPFREILVCRKGKGQDRVKE